MRKIIFAASLLFTTIFGATAQSSFGGQPISFSNQTVLNYATSSKADVDQSFVELSKPNMAEIVAEDMAVNSKQSYRVATNIQTSLNMVNAGTWTVLKDGTRVWKLSLKVQDAQALGLYFDDVIIPVGAKLFMYNNSKSQVIGSFTSETPKMLASEMIEGEIVHIEYNEPVGTVGEPYIGINEVAYFYRGVEDRVGAYRDYQSFSAKAESCQVNVACSEANAWQDQVDAVVHYTFSQGGGTYVCSAALINNTSQDCKPYILTATHCGEPQSTTALNSNVWYFNYENPNCSPGATAQYPKPSSTATGATFRASSKNTWPIENANQVYGTDFTLVELPTGTTLPTNAYFAGWDRNTTASASGVGIHHPAGHDKKISTYGADAGLVSDTYNGGLANGHWEVQWSSTTNGHGVTEGGSSGSPIFNASGLIVGMLSGGSSFCSALTATDLYGKVDVSWDPAGANANGRLKDWLDPTNTGAMTQAGIVTPCSATPQAPVADFTANNTSVFEAATVTFTNTSTFLPTSWSWSITAGTQGVEWDYANGTSSTDQNIQITFNTAGTYSVSMTATNATGSDTETKTGYITVTAITCDDVTAANFTADFDGTDFSQWVIVNANGDNAANAAQGGGVFSLVNFGAGGAHSDSIAMRYLWNSDATTPADDWFMTGCLEITAPGDYNISYWYRTGAGYSENIEAFLGTDKTVAAMTQSFGAQTNVESATWVEVTGTVSVAAAGTYYLGFHCTSAADKFYVAVDDINLSAVAPVYTLTLNTTPADVTISCEASTDVANTGNVTASSDCTTGSVTIVSNDVVTAGSCANASSIERTFTVTDGCGNTQTHVQTITIEDNTAPEITCTQSTDELHTSSSIALPTYTATITDNCSSVGNVTLTQSPVAGTMLSPGNYDVTLTATDECGNTNTCTVTVVIINDDGVTITHSPADVTVSCDASTLEANTGVLTAQTSCAGNVTIQANDVVTNGSCAGNYSIARTWTVTDDCAHTETYTQTITVEDTEAPSITCGQTTDNLTAQEGMSCPDYTAGATTADNCSGTINVTQSPAAASQLETGANVVTLTATDECGNTNTCTIAVSVQSNVGIEENELLQNVNVYPNPVTANVTVDFSGVDAQEYEVEVYDMTGKLVAKSGKQDSIKVNVDLSALTKGIYQVKLRADKHVSVKKITKL